MNPERELSIFVAGMGFGGFLLLIVLALLSSNQEEKKCAVCQRRINDDGTAQNAPAPMPENSDPADLDEAANWWKHGKKPMGDPW